MIKQKQSLLLLYVPQVNTTSEAHVLLAKPQGAKLVLRTCVSLVSRLT